MHTLLTASGTLLLSFALALPLPAASWLSGNDLEQSCSNLLENPDSDKGLMCVAFVQGFLAASRTEAELYSAAPSDDSNGTSESYSDRAARTRLGTLRMMQLSAADRADYCINDSIPALEIVESIASYLQDHPETLQMTDTEAVREALAYNYSCDE